VKARGHAKVRKPGTLQGSANIAVESRASPQTIRERAWIAAAEVYLRENFSHSFDRIALSQHVGISDRHLYQILLAHGKPSPARIHLEIRIEHAARLLLKRGTSVAEVARASGYANTRKFAQAFRKAKGMNPSEWQATMIPRPAPNRLSQEVLDHWLPDSPRPS
jgi:AraC-like DNA-binding protein